MNDQTAGRVIVTPEETKTNTVRYDMLNKAFSEAKEANPNFELDDNNRELFQALALYFSNDPLFEKKGFGSLKKGLMLRGNVGVGKTSIMRAFKFNHRGYFETISVNSVVANYQKFGQEGIERFHIKSSGFCFDDLGTESTSAKYMGNELNVMESIIMSRYEAMIPFYKTHITTNLTADDLEEFYGKRVRSRMREMFNTFLLEGKDRRK